MNDGEIEEGEGYSVQADDSVGKKLPKACSGALLRMIAATVCIAGAIATCTYM